MTDRKPPRWKEGTWAGLPHFECTECPFDTLDRGAIVAHARENHPRLWEGGELPEAGPLAGIDFASDEAGERAARAGLTRRQFQGRTPSGKSGFTAADVKTIAAQAKQEA